MGIKERMGYKNPNLEIGFFEFLFRDLGKEETGSRLFRAAPRITITLFQYKPDNDIFGHQCQTVNPQKVHNKVGFILQTIQEYRPPDENNILYIIEEENSRSIKLFKYLHRAYPSKLGVPSGICSVFSRLASCSAS